LSFLNPEGGVMQKVKPNLAGVSETLLISLWSRAQAIKRDTKAKELVSRIDYDFSRFDSWKGRLKYTVLRTSVFDAEVSGFLKDHPDAVVVNVGAGLDTRFFRLDNGKIMWYELDLPAVIALRRQFFEESDRYRFIESSLSDGKWVADVKEKDRPVLFICEGVLMYLEKSDVKSFFMLVSKHFASAEMVCEVVGPVGTKLKHPLITAMESNPALNWGIWFVRSLEHWHDSIRVVGVHVLSDSLASFLISMLLGNRVVHLWFGQRK
jgi:O-methyltransferase involved in polyketide biosynthesis